MTVKDTASDILAEYRAYLWPIVQEYLQDPAYPEEFQIPEEYTATASKQWEMVREYPERQGKYLRPTLVMLAAEAMGETRESVAQVAAAMQLSEEWLLVHDDFEDGSTMRRGRPALHETYGAELAVNAGDALHVIMWRAVMASREELGAEKTYAIADEFSKALLRTTQGQGMEIMWTQDVTQRTTDEDWYVIADGKTAYYTMALPLRLGAVAAGATEAQLVALTQFSQYLGRCFQLVDDILDVTSEYRGQAAGGDIREGKLTIPLLHLLRHASVVDCQRLTVILDASAAEKREEDVAWVLEKMHAYGSVTYSWEVAADLKRRAEEMFTRELGFLSEQPARGRLENLMHFILERRY